MTKQRQKYLACKVDKESMKWNGSIGGLLMVGFNVLENLDQKIKWNEHLKDCSNEHEFQKNRLLKVEIKESWLKWFYLLLKLEIKKKSDEAT